MKMETNKPIGLVLTELIFKNLFWFLIFSFLLVCSVISLYNFGLIHPPNKNGFFTSASYRARFTSNQLFWLFNASSMKNSQYASVNPIAQISSHNLHKTAMLLARHIVLHIIKIHTHRQLFSQIVLSRPVVLIRTR